MSRSVFPSPGQQKNPKRLDWLKSKGLRTHTQNRPSHGQSQALWLFVVLVVTALTALSQLRGPERLTAQAVPAAEQPTDVAAPLQAR